MWEYYDVPPWRFRVKLKTGEYAYFGATLMRRKLADGIWEYRRPTDEEGGEYQSMTAW